MRSPCRQSGFSLIELLVSITVLVILVTVAALLVNSSDRTSHDGISRSTMASDASTVLATIRNDIESMAEPSRFVLCSDRYSTRSYDALNVNSELCFLTLKDSETPTNGRAFTEVFYWVSPVTNGGVTSYELVRALRPVTNMTDTNNSYSSQEWYKDTREGRPAREFHDVILRNIAAFHVFVLVSYNFGATNSVMDTYLPGDSGRPLFVDMFLEVLDDKAVRQVSALQTAADQASFVDRKALRYTTRIFLRNRIGLN
ncbi:MAG: hypothetical protein C0404_14000 [Verrucomicrobia bacterium]|nr:hypothetical protein [Verrucomicrobiota bacterium]